MIEKGTKLHERAQSRKIEPSKSLQKSFEREVQEKQEI